MGRVYGRLEHSMSENAVADVIETAENESTEGSKATDSSWRRGFWSLVITQFQGGIL